MIPPSFLVQHHYNHGKIFVTLLSAQNYRLVNQPRTLQAVSQNFSTSSSPSSPSTSSLPSSFFSSSSPSATQASKPTSTTKTATPSKTTSTLKSATPTPTSKSETPTPTSPTPTSKTATPTPTSKTETPARTPKSTEASPSPTLGTAVTKTRTSKLRTDLENVLKQLQQRREYRATGTIPPPRDGLNVEFFLKRIGYGCSEYASVFPTWESLFEMTVYQMKKNSIPTKQRRWILNWREKYLQGVNPPYVPKGKWVKKE